MEANYKSILKNLSENKISIGHSYYVNVSELLFFQLSR